MNISEMGVKLIISIILLYVHIETASSQFDYHNNMQNSMYQNQFQNNYPPQEYDGIEEMDYYDNEPREYYRRSRHYKRRPYGNSGGKLPRGYSKYVESDECRCTCIRCDDPDPCCKDVCSNCNMQESPQGGQANLVFVPYPYPLIVTPKVIDRQQKTSSGETLSTSPSTTTKTTPIETTTTKMATTTETDDIFEEGRRLFKGANYYPDIETEIRHNYMLTPLRRTKSAWLPKYGIVSLPNNLAEKLMSKLRDVKELQKRRV